MPFRRIRMIKLVKLSVRTSEVEDARAKSSDVNSINGAAIFVAIGLNLFKLVQTCLNWSGLVQIGLDLLNTIIHMSFQA